MKRQNKNNNKGELTRAKRYVLRLLGRRPYSKKEVEDKLRRQGFGEVIIKQVREELTKLNLINDEEFATSYVEAKLSGKPKGHLLLTRDLQRKGINPEIIKKVINRFLPKEKEILLAQELAEKKIKKERSLSKAPIKQKLYFYLRGRGFTEEIIEEVMEKINYE